MANTKAQATEPLNTALLVATIFFSCSVLKWFKNKCYFFTSKPHRNAASKVELHAKNQHQLGLYTHLWKLLLMPFASHVHTNRS